MHPRPRHRPELTLAGLICVLTPLTAGASIGRLSLPLAPAPLCTLPLLGSALAVDEDAGRDFVAGGGGTGAGSVATLDARSGRPLRTVAVATLPVALAVDSPTRRVFVACATGRRVAVLDHAPLRALGTASP